MKFHCIFVATFVCILNVASTLYVASFPYQPQKCYDEFTLKTNAFVTEVKSKTLSCNKNTENDKSSFDLRNGGERKEFQSFVEDKIKRTQDALEKCAKETSAAEYFQCVISLEHVHRDFLSEINSKSRKYSRELDRIDHDKQYCMDKIVDKSKSTSAVSDLQQCILKSSESISTETTSLTPSTTPLPQKDYTNDEHLTELKKVYNTLWECTNDDDEDDYALDKCLKESTDNPDLEMYLRMHATDYFPTLNKIDNAQNICLRHLASFFITDKNYIGQFFDCLRNGRQEASRSDEINENMARKLEIFAKSMPRCTNTNTNRYETEQCVDKWFSAMPTDLAVDVYTILDEKIDELISYADLVKDGSCLRYAVKRLQFDGVFMEDREKEALVDCFYNH